MYTCSYIALDRNINLTVGVVLLGATIAIHGSIVLFKENYQNLQEIGFLLCKFIGNLCALNLHDQFAVNAMIILWLHFMHFFLRNYYTSHH